MSNLMWHIQKDYLVFAILLRRLHLSVSIWQLPLCWEEVYAFYWETMGRRGEIRYGKQGFAEEAAGSVP